MSKGCFWSEQQCVVPTTIILLKEAIVTYPSIKDTNPDHQSYSEMQPFPFPLDSE